MITLHKDFWSTLDPSDPYYEDKSIYTYRTIDKGKESSEEKSTLWNRFLLWINYKKGE